MADNIQLLPPAQRAATTTSPTFTNVGAARGLILYLNVTQASGTGGLTPHVLAADPVSGATQDLGTIGSAKLATGLFVYTLYPAASMAAVNGGSLVYPLPQNWSIRIAHGDGSNYTYSLSADPVT